MNKLSWVLGSKTVEELYEYKNLRVLKNHVGSFSSNVLDNVEKSQKKVGMLFSANFDHRKVNPCVYIKFCVVLLLFVSICPGFGSHLAHAHYVVRHVETQTWLI